MPVVDNIRIWYMKHEGTSPGGSDPLGGGGNKLDGMPTHDVTRAAQRSFVELPGGGGGSMPGGANMGGNPGGGPEEPEG